MGLVIGLFSNLSSILAGLVQEQGKFTLRKSSKFISHFEIGKTSRNDNGVCKCAWAISININSFSDLIEFPETVTVTYIFLSFFFSFKFSSDRFLLWYCSWHDTDARPMVYKHRTFVKKYFFLNINFFQIDFCDGIVAGMMRMRGL